ncbi:DUF3221 domain-containing protein [Sporosarcina sp. FSL W7-1349]|uniref:DUF3221 domain-containing protein n=1 Tax=Sporosarcina sp. FSL W7-1349 TaxID=2921561 RepID=UPI0030FB4E40
MGIRQVVIGFVLIALLAACDRKEETFTFTGMIQDSRGHSALVLVDEGESILRSGSEVTINLSVNKEETFENGDRVEVTYNGEVMESSPLQIKTISVEKVE